MDLWGTITWIVCGGISLVLVGMVLFGVGGSSSQPSAPSASSSSGPVPGPGPASVNSSDPRTAEVKAMLTRVSTETDPRQCTEDMTPAFVRQIYARAGGNPLANCIQSNSDSDVQARAVQIDGLAVHGAAAQGSVRVTAGGMAGTSMTVALVSDQGRWKLDRLIDLHLNRARLDDVYKKALMSKGLTEAQAQCVVEGIDRNFNDMDMLGLGASGEAQIREIVAGCVQATAA